MVQHIWYFVGEFWIIDSLLLSYKYNISEGVVCFFERANLWSYQTDLKISFCIWLIKYVWSFYNSKLCQKFRKYPDYFVVRFGPKIVSLLSKCGYTRIFNIPVVLSPVPCYKNWTIGRKLSSTLHSETTYSYDYTNTISHNIMTWP